MDQEDRAEAMFSRFESSPGNTSSARLVLLAVVLEATAVGLFLGRRLRHPQRPHPEGSGVVPPALTFASCPVSSWCSRAAALASSSEPGPQAQEQFEQVTQNSMSFTQAAYDDRLRRRWRRSYRRIRGWARAPPVSPQSGELYFATLGSEMTDSVFASDEVEIRVGQAAHFPKGVTQAKGSEAGMVALMIQVDVLDLGGEV